LISKASGFVGGLVKKVSPMLKKFTGGNQKEVAEAQTAAKTFVNQLNKDANGKALAQL
tara:strand:- start:282 stop:455 length:174 start_codon:yes stop_codon:yes gene_type:complete